MNTHCICHVLDSFIDFIVLTFLLLLPQFCKTRFSLACNLVLTFDPPSCSLSSSLSLIFSDKRVRSRGKQRVRCCTSFACIAWECLSRRYLRSELEVQSKLQMYATRKVYLRPRNVHRIRRRASSAKLVARELRELISYRVRGRWGNYCCLVKMKFVLSPSNSERTRRNIWAKKSIIIRDEECT